jgi:hypothetical protein
MMRVSGTAADLFKKQIGLGDRRMNSGYARVSALLALVLLTLSVVLAVPAFAQRSEGALLLRGPVEAQNKARTSIRVLGQTVQLPRAEKFAPGTAVAVYGALRADGTFAVSAVRSSKSYVSGADSVVLSGRVALATPTGRAHVGSVAVDYTSVLAANPSVVLKAGDLIRVGGIQPTARGRVIAGAQADSDSGSGTLVVFGIPYSAVSVFDALAPGNAVLIDGEIPSSGVALIGVSSSAGGLVGTNAGGLVGTNAGGLVGTNAGGLVGTNAGGLVGTNAGGLVGTNAGGLVGTNAGGLVGTNAGGLVGTNAGGLVGTNAGGLVGTNAGGLVGTNAGGLVGTNAGGLVGTNAGGLVGTNAGGLVGTNAGGLVGTNAGGLVGTNAGGLVGTNAGGLVGTNAGGLVGTNAGGLVGTNAVGALHTSGDGSVITH